MKTRLTNTARKVREKCTRRNVLWFLGTNVQSWILQGLLVGLLTVVGVGAVASVVSAKVTAYVVFAAQCIAKARS